MGDRSTRRRQRPEPSREAAITLVEVLVAAGIGALVLGGLARAAITTSHTTAGNEAAAADLSEARNTVDAMARTIRTLRPYDHYDHGVVPVFLGGSAGAGDTHLGFFANLRVDERPNPPVGPKAVFYQVDGGWVYGWTQTGEYTTDPDEKAGRDLPYRYQGWDRERLLSSQLERDDIFTYLDDAGDPLTFQTTDENGNYLSEDEYVAANQEEMDALHGIRITVPLHSRPQLPGGETTLQRTVYPPNIDRSSDD